MSSFAWFPRARDYGREDAALACTSTPTRVHPLLGDVYVPEDAGPQGTDGNQKIAEEEEPLDPLSQLAAEPVTVNPLTSYGVDPVSKKTPDQDASTDLAHVWAVKRTSILSQYTTSELLTIVTSVDGEQGPMKVQVVARDQPQQRLGQLADESKVSGLSQTDYVNRIMALNQDLITAWDSDQRVKALKIVIQCAKLLCGTDVLPFYPSKFVLISEVFDTFGRLVYNRIMAKAQTSAAKQNATLSGGVEEVSIKWEAKETCRNWFYKVASIRELVPRIYAEIAILRCLGFIDPSGTQAALIRLNQMINGVGDPLVATYMRTYLCKTGALVTPQCRTHYPQFIQSAILSQQYLTQHSGVSKQIASQKLSMGRYLWLYAPALDLIMHCATTGAQEAELQRLQSAILSIDPLPGPILLSVLQNMPPPLVSGAVEKYLLALRTATGTEQHLLYQALGTRLSKSSPAPHLRRGVLNEVWRVIGSLEDPSAYMQCAVSWVEYVVNCFGDKEKNIVLNDIVAHMTLNRAFEAHHRDLHTVLVLLVDSVHDFSKLFALDKFLSFLDLFQQEDAKQEAYLTLLSAFVRQQRTVTGDPVVIGGMMYVASALHGAVTASSLDSYVQHLATLTANFISKVSFGQDYEQQLNFYVSVRGSFFNLQPVMVSLVHRVNGLIVATRHIVKSRHTKKTAAFVRACAAFNYITVPSVASISDRIYLYLLCGQTALVNNALVQADAFFKAAITTLPEIIEADTATDSYQRKMTALKTFVATLVLIPDSPQTGMLYMVKGLMNVLQSCKWDPQTEDRSDLYLGIARALSAMAQERYLYTIDGVEGNDALYGHSEAFLAEIRLVVGVAIDQAMAHLQDLVEGGYTTRPRRYQVSLDILNVTLSCGDISVRKTASLAVNLWKLARKNQPDGKKQLGYLTSTLKYVRTRAIDTTLPKSTQQAYADLLPYLQ